jgi:predicted NAD-dependent protein-ADP-ribosyltransferase YbiA (DUF1768 family)
VAIDIGIHNSYPANRLSNLAVSPFVMDGVQCNSMEGFIQALKRREPKVQEHGCTLAGMAAKRWGAGVKWWKRPVREQLWWHGRGFAAHSEEHFALVKRTLLAKFTQHEPSRRALLATGDAHLVHSAGKRERTSLKASDFCRMLMEIREELRQEQSREGRPECWGRKDCQKKIAGVS